MMQRATAPDGVGLQIVEAPIRVDTSPAGSARFVPAHEAPARDARIEIVKGAILIEDGAEVPAEEWRTPDAGFLVPHDLNPTVQPSFAAARDVAQKRYEARSMKRREAMYADLTEEQRRDFPLPTNTELYPFAKIEWETL